MLSAYFLRLDGSEVWVAGRSPRTAVKAPLAEASGARYVSTSETSLAALSDDLGGFDLVIEAAGDAQVMLDTLALPAVSVGGMASIDEVVEQLTNYSLATLPVVDFEGRLLGVIRQDVLMKAARQEVAADIQAMVGASREERALSRVSFSGRARLPWLEINLLTAFLASAVVGLFESTIAAFTALAVLLPVVAGQSGNTGAQALAVTMRGLALREIRVSQWARVVRKETAVAFFNGWVVALTTALGVLVWSRSPGLALVIGRAFGTIRT